MTSGKVRFVGMLFFVTSCGFHSYWLDYQPGNKARNPLVMLFW